MAVYETIPVMFACKKMTVLTTVLRVASSTQKFGSCGIHDRSKTKHSSAAHQALRSIRVTLKMSLLRKRWEQLVNRMTDM